MENKNPAEEEVKQPETQAETAAEAETEAASEVSEAMAALQAKLDALNDQHLRMAAEYDNFRKRSQRERESAHAEAVAYAVKALLPTYDNLERALKAETTDTEYKKGVELTMTQLVESLKGIGVEKIAAEPGTAFDPNLHNAVMHIENEELGENVIAEVFQQGFQIGDKVIRHAMVQVAN
ncbi:MAG: nucleotide exchange factor GrpE [Butyricicoccus sp.]